MARGAKLNEELSKCDEKISREHHVSASILKFFEAGISVQGFSWCKEEPKQVGIGSLTAKHLCRKHNSALSKTDKAAALFEAIGNQFFSDSVVSERQSVSVTQNRLERWSLKTAINFRMPVTQEVASSSLVDPV
jgi:hypothetical protein